MAENHEEYWEMISAALDGELPAPERTALDRHLAQCPACAALFEELAAQSAALRSLDCTPPEDLNLRIWRTIHPQADLQEPPAPLSVSGRSTAKTLRPAELATPEEIQACLQQFPGKDAPATKPSFRGMRALWTALAALAACAVLMVGLRLPGLFQSIEGTASGGDPAVASLPEGDPVPYSGSSTGGTSGTDPVEPISGLARGITLPDPAEDPASGAGADSGAGAGAGSAASGPVSAGVPFGIGGTTALDLSIPFENPQVLRVSWSHTPVSDCAWVFSSAEDLADFLAQFPLDDLSGLQEQYDSTFFSQHQLVAAVRESSSGSVAYSIPQNGLTEDCLTIGCKIPETGTCDMAAWLLTAEVSAGTLPAGNSLPVAVVPN